MCDFAPRQSCDFSLAILQLVAATAGLLTPRPVFVAAGETPPRVVDIERELAIELDGAVAAINREDRK